MKPVSFFFLFVEVNVIASSTSPRIPAAGTRTENNSLPHAFAKDQPKWVSSWHMDAEKPSFPCPPPQVAHVAQLPTPQLQSTSGLPWIPWQLCRRV